MSEHRSEAEGTGIDQDRSEEPATRKYLVGIDGSTGAQAALAWAVADARRDPSIEIDAVIVWQPPVYPAMFEGSVATFDVKGHEEHVRADLDRLVSKVDTTGLAHPVNERTVIGSPSTVLTDLSAEYDLLVLGALGRGGFVGLVMGSVSERCLSHAKCPVAIVRGGTPAAQVAA